MEDVVVSLENAVRDEQKELEFWKGLNRQCCDHESVVSAGAWLEADKTGF
ncbi:hypothetical protein [Nitratidesulfovibrio sp. 1201_IL3209]